VSAGGRNLPRPTPETAPFWDGCRAGRLLIQRCAACGNRQFYPRLVCTRCAARRLEWLAASGRATVESFTVVRQAISPAYAGDVPYVVAIVRLAEGPTMMSNIVQCEPEQVAIGMAVTVVFEPLDADITLPKFRPA
jgi:uncharacterized OB-fold protein